MIRRTKEKLALQYDSTVSFFADAVLRMQAHEGFKRYFKNTGWLFFGRIGSMVVTFLVGVYFARYLGPAQYGLVNYAVSFAGLFIFLNSCGIDAILVRSLLESPEKRDDILGTSFIIKLIGGATALVAAAGAASLFSSDQTANAFIFLIAISYVFQAFNVVDFFFQAKVLSKKIVIVQLATSLILAAVKLLLIYMHAPLISFILIYIMEAVILAIGFIALYFWHKLSMFLWRFDLSLAKKMLHDAFPLMFSNIAAAVFFRIDQVMIKNMLGNEAAGVYAVAARLSEIWYFIPFIIVGSLFPAIVNAKKISVDMYESRLRRLYSFMIWSSVLIAVPTTLLASPLISFLFGPSYVSAAGVLKIYVWSGIAIFLWSAVGQALIAENQTKISFWATFWGAVANVALNFVLIPWYGIYGAAAATLISYFVVIAAVFTFRQSRRQCHLVTRAFYFK